MENVLISFKTDTAALDEINQKLVILKQNMAGVVTGGTMTQSSPVPKANTYKNTSGVDKKTVDDLIKANQILYKVNDDLTKKYDEMSKKFNSYQANYKSSVDGAKKSIDELSKAQKNVNAVIGEKAATESFRTQLKKLREEMIALDVAGQSNSARYQELVKKAGDLNDTIKDTSATIKNAGSDTEVFDSISGGLQLATGGLAAFQGAAALFGGESEDLQKTMMNLQGGISLAVGAGQALNAVQQDGAIIVGVKKIRTLAAAAAENMATKGTIAATVAQRIFNAVAKANPYVLLAMALITVVGALYMFSKGTDESAEKQKRANELDEARIDALERVSQVYKNAGDKREKALNNELELLKVSGASQAEVAKKESQLLAEKLSNASEQYNLHKKDIDSLQQNIDKVDQLRAAIKLMEDAKDHGQKNVVFSINGEMRKVKVSDEAIAELRKEFDTSENVVNVSVKYKEDYEKADLEKKKHNEQQKVDAIKNAKSEAIAAAEVRLIEAKKGSADELVAKIGVIAAQRRADMDNANLTYSQKELLMKKANKDEEDARNEYLVKNLEDEKSNINAKLLLSKEGSKEELDYRIQILEKQKDIDLQNAKDSKAKQSEVEAGFLKEKQKLTKDFNDKQTQESISNDINYINTSLSLAREGSSEEYKLKLELIEKQRALEEKQINASLDNEQTKLAKIFALNAKSQKEITDLTYEKQKSALDKNLSIQNLKLSNDYKTGLISKSDYESQKEQLTINGLKRDIDLKRANNESTIELEQQLADKEIELKQKTEEAKAEAAKAAFDTVVMLGNSIYDGEKQRLNQQMSDLDHYYTTDAEAAKKNKELKLISEAEYNRRQLKLKQEMAKADKKQAIFNVIMSTIQAVAGILAAKPIGPWNFALAAIMAAQGAIQIAAIKSQPLPKYWKGKKGNQSGKGEMAWVGEHGPEMMWVPSGAAILPAHKSNKIRDAIGILKDYNIPARFPNVPEMPFVNSKALVEAKAGKQVSINYELLASKIGDQMEKRIRLPKLQGQRPVSINVDHSGTTVSDGNTTTIYRNRKYVGNV